MNSRLKRLRQFVMSTSEDAVERGKKLFKLHCAMCHTVDGGNRRKSGPDLKDIVGKTAGQVPGYDYSEANKNKGVTWTKETLSLFLENPKKYMPGNKMFFAGMKKEAERHDIVAFLQSTAK